MFLPPSCAVCDRPGSVLCAPCRADLRPAPELACPEGLARLSALLAYEGAGRRLVTAIKYRRGRGVVPGLARALAARLDDDPVDIVTWLPTTAARRRARGFDQARLLAQGVARARGLPVAALLRRRPGPTQTGRSARERREGPELVARANAFGRVLLVDDVVTTGASMTAAARALHAAGGASVMGAALARTPLPAPSGTRVGGHTRSIPGLKLAEQAPIVDEVPDEVPDGLLDRLREAPPVRLDRLAEARSRLANGAQPSDDDLARRLVGRLVCDRLR